jgi:hypothetical protein
MHMTEEAIWMDARRLSRGAEQGTCSGGMHAGKVQTRGLGAAGMGGWGPTWVPSVVVAVLLLLLSGWSAAGSAGAPCSVSSTSRASSSGPRASLSGPRASPSGP